MPLRSTIPWTLALLVTLAPFALHAQTAVFAPLPAAFSPQSSRPFVTNPTGFAYAAGDSIFAVTGLPGPPVSTQVITPAGQLALDPWTWTILADDVALYRTTAHELVLVRGLPATPTLIPTGIVLPTFGWLRPVNATTAVMVDPVTNAFQVLRHDSVGATLTTLAAPAPISTSAGGPHGGSRWLALVGTAQLAIIDGLAGPPAGFQLQIATIPAAGPLEGLVVNDAGTAVAWRVPSAGNLEATTILVGQGGPTYSAFTVSAPPGYMGPGPVGPAGTAGFDPGRGDDMLAWFWDELLVDRYYWALKEASGSHMPYAHWCQDAFGCTIAANVREQELVWYTVFGGLPLTWTDYSGPAPVSRTFPIAGEPVGFYTPNEDTLVVAATSPSGASAFMNVVTDLRGAATMSSVPIPFTTTSYPAFAQLGSGRMLVLRNDSVPSPSNAIWTVMLPARLRLGDTSPAFGPHLTTVPREPRLGLPYRFQVTSFDTASAMSLVFASASGTPVPLGPPTFMFDSVLHLDPAAVLLILPLVNVSGLGVLDVDLAAWPVVLAGLPIYVQAVEFSWAVGISEAYALLIG